MDIQAAKARCEAATAWGDTAGEMAMLEFAAYARKYFPAALEALEEAQEKLKHWEHGVARDQDCPYKVERDRYKALAERCREALADCATALHADRMHEGRFKDCERWGCAGARAAIDMKPEEAREVRRG